MVFAYNNIDGNYTLCIENLSKTKKTLTLHYSIMNSLMLNPSTSKLDVLEIRVQELYIYLIQVSVNIEMIRTRENVHYECNYLLKHSD